MSKHYGKTLKVPIWGKDRPCYLGRHEEIFIDKVDENMAYRINQAYVWRFSGKRNLESELIAAAEFSRDMAERLPYLGEKSFIEYDRTFMSKKPEYSNYLEICAWPRTLSAATGTNDIDCVIHALAIHCCLPDEGWELFHTYDYPHSIRKSRTRHMLVARRIGDSFVLIDPSKMHKTVQPREFHREEQEIEMGFFAPVIE